MDSLWELIGFLFMLAGVLGFVYANVIAEAYIGHQRRKKWLATLEGKQWEEQKDEWEERYNEYQRRRRSNG